MYDESDDSTNSSDVSDVSDGGSSQEVSDNDELVDTPEVNDDLMSKNEAEVEDELMEEDHPPGKEKNAEAAKSKEKSTEEKEKPVEEKTETNEKTKNEKTETNEKTKEEKTETSEKTKDEKTEIKEKSEYSDEVNDHISSTDELEVYQKAGLKEENIDGRTCLVRPDIDMEYVDPKTGKTNRELMEEGRSPYDSKTGEKIELHHIGQEYDSPLAELTEDSEHGAEHSTLHTKESESWRQDAEKNNRYNNVDRPNHWKARARKG